MLHNFLINEPVKKEWIGNEAEGLLEGEPEEAEAAKAAEDAAAAATIASACA